MSFHVDVEESQLDIDDEMRGLTRDRHTKKSLREDIGASLDSGSHGSGFDFHSVSLLTSIRRYSEQLYSDIEGDLAMLFDITSGRDIDSSFSDLRYFSDRLYEYNKSVEGAVGEGLAGLLIERQGFDPLARPLNTVPDILMQDSTTRIAFVEAKATIEGNIHTSMKHAAIDVIELLAK